MKNGDTLKPFLTCEHEPVKRIMVYAKQDADSDGRSNATTMEKKTTKKREK